MESRVIAISPPLKSKAMVLKQKEEIIDLDIDEDCKDVVLFQGNKKVKGAMDLSLGPTKAELVSIHDDTGKKVDSNNKGKDVSMMGIVKLDSKGPGDCSKSLIDVDDFALEDDNYSMALQLQSQFDSNVYALEDDNCMALQLQSQFDLENNTFEDDYSMALQLQSQFDNTDIPTNGIKENEFETKKNSSVDNSSTSSGLHANNSSKKNSSFTESYSSMGKDFDNVDVLESYESDFSDDDYATPNPRMDQPPKNPAKRIKDAKRISEEKLPATMDMDALSKRNWGYYEPQHGDTKSFLSSRENPLLMNQNGRSSMAAAYNHLPQNSVVSESLIPLQIRNPNPPKKRSALAVLEENLNHTGQLSKAVKRNMDLVTSGVDRGISEIVRSYTQTPKLWGSDGSQSVTCTTTINVSVTKEYKMTWSNDYKEEDE